MMIYQLTNDIICSLQTTTIWKSTLNCFANGFLILNIPSTVLLYQFWWSAVRIQLVFTAGIGEVWRILGDHMVFMTQPWHSVSWLSLWRRANVRNVSFETLHGAQFTLSTQLISLNYPAILESTLVTQEFLKSSFLCRAFFYRHPIHILVREDVSLASERQCTYIIVITCPAPRLIPWSCAIQRAQTPSYNAVPSILTVAPNGRTKRLIRLSTWLFCSTHLMVVGKVAALN